MELTWKGINSFYVKSKQGSISVAPNSSEEAKADICILYSSLDGEALKITQGDEVVMNYPGEYEIKDMLVTGVEIREERTNPEEIRTSFAVTLLEGITIGFLGDLHEKLKGDQVEDLGRIDILTVSLLDSLIDPKMLRDIIDEIDPKIVVPAGYADEAHLKAFLSALDWPQVEHLDTLKATSTDLSPDMKKVVVLKKV